MADKYVSTILAQENTILEIQKADLDLLKKVNEVNNRITVSTVAPTNDIGANGDIWVVVSV